MGKASRKKKQVEIFQTKPVHKKKSSSFFHTVVILLIIFAAAAFQRNAMWEDGISLWEDVVEKSPNKSRGYNDLGNAYDEQGQINEAISKYKTALKKSGLVKKSVYS